VIGGKKILMAAAAAGAAAASGNDFSAATFKALWRFEPGNLYADSIGGNTLQEGTAPDSDAVDFKEGAGCAQFVRENGDFLYIPDIDLDPEFPCKSGETNDDFSIAFWCKFASIPVTSYLVGKWAFGAAGGWMVRLLTSGTIQFSYVRDTGSWINFSHTSVLLVGTWYHVGVGFENTNHDHIICIHDTDGNAVGTHKVGTHWAAMGIAATDFKVGYNMDARIDEAVHADTKLTAADFQKMALGTYGS